MPSYLGTKDLGLKTDWRYGFAGLAQRATTTHGVLYIGAGRALMPGHNLRAYLRRDGRGAGLRALRRPAGAGGPGRIWHRFTDRGDIGYTTFYATRRVTRARRDDCRRLVAGMARAQAALFRATPAALADAVAEFLPDQPRAALARMIAASRASGLWARRPDLPAAPYLRLKAALVSGGLIRRDPPYEQVVDRALSQIP